MVHLDFVCQPYRDQMDAGRYFLHEHPASASSWEERCSASLLGWTDSGLEYEADPRQIEHMMVDLGLEGAKTVGTAGVKIDAAKSRADQPLGWEKHTLHRAITARGKYVCADRPDTQFASKELCRWMAGPTESGLHGLKRLGKYLEGHT